MSDKMNITNKIMIGLGMFIGLYFVFVIFVFLMVDVTCEITQIASKVSPDGDYKVIIENKVCTEKNNKKIDANEIYVFIKKYDENEKNKVFVAQIKNSGEEYIDVKWVSSTVLLVSFSGLRVQSKESDINGVNVQYREIDKNNNLYRDADTLLKERSLNITKERYSELFKDVEQVFVTKITLLEDLDGFATTEDEVYEVRIIGLTRTIKAIIFVKPDDETSIRLR